MDSTLKTPVPTSQLPRNFVLAFLKGAMYPFSALFFMRKNQLWVWAVVPMIINVIIFVGVIILGIQIVGPWVQNLEVYFSQLNLANSWLMSLMAFLGWLIWIGMAILIILMSGVIILLLGQAVAAPFLDILSEKVESIVLGAEPPPFSPIRTLRSLWVALVDLVSGLTLLVVVNVPIFLLGLTGLGSLPAAMLSYCFTSLLFAHEFLGLALARMNVSYFQRWHAVMATPWLNLGFGSTAFLFLLVPGLNIVLLPLLAVSGTLLYCDLKNSGYLQAYIRT